MSLRSRILAQAQSRISGGSYIPMGGMYGGMYGGLIRPVRRKPKKGSPYYVLVQDRDDEVDIQMEELAQQMGLPKGFYPQNFTGPFSKIYKNTEVRRGYQKRKTAGPKTARGLSWQNVLQKARSLNPNYPWTVRLAMAGSNTHKQQYTGRSRSPYVPRNPRTYFFGEAPVAYNRKQ